MKKKKKKFTFKKIKKVFAAIGSDIKEKFIKLRKKFLLLPKKTQIIIKIWAIVLVVLLILIFASILNNKHINKYKGYEQLLANATYTYFSKEELHASSDQPEKVDLMYLIDQGFINDDEIKDKSCVGFGYIYDSEDSTDSVTKGYINCKHYTTSGYTKIK